MVEYFWDEAYNHVMSDYRHLTLQPNYFASKKETATRILPDSRLGGEQMKKLLG